MRSAISSPCGGLAEESDKLNRMTLQSALMIDVQVGVVLAPLKGTQTRIERRDSKNISRRAEGCKGGTRMCGNEV